MEICSALLYYPCVYFNPLKQFCVYQNSIDILLTQFAFIRKCALNRSNTVKFVYFQHVLLLALGC